MFQNSKEKLKIYKTNYNPKIYTRKFLKHFRANKLHVLDIGKMKTYIMLTLYPESFKFIDLSLPLS